MTRDGLPGAGVHSLFSAKRVARCSSLKRPKYFSINQHFRGPSCFALRMTPHWETKKSLPLRMTMCKFSQVKDKTLEEVDFSTDTEDHSITLVFRDKTALRFD